MRGGYTQPSAFRYQSWTHFNPASLFDLRGTQRHTLDGKDARAGSYLPQRRKSDRRAPWYPPKQSPLEPCLDFAKHGQKCKHIYAAEYAAGRENSSRNGTTAKVLTVTQAKRGTSPQDWPAYNQAQTHEKVRKGIF